VISNRGPAPALKNCEWINQQELSAGPYLPAEGALRFPTGRPFYWRLASALSSFCNPRRAPGAGALIASESTPGVIVTPNTLTAPRQSIEWKTGERREAMPVELESAPVLCVGERTERRR
jgi:hypothetical protein